MEEVLKKIKSWLFGSALLFAIFSILPATAQAAILYFSPSSGTHAIGTIFTVSVYVSSADQAMNAASGVISFPTDKLAVDSLSKSGSIFSLWVQEPSFSNSAGTINFEGIVLNPGFTGSSGKAINITFRTKAAGNASLTFSDASALANDGKGTNILTGMGDANFSIGVVQPGAPEIITPTEVAGTPAAPAISSPTHPDQNKWYSNNNPVFKWELPSDVKEVKLVLSKHSSSAPLISYTPPISEKSLTDLEDGVWYLNGRFRTSAGWGPVASFRFQIDTKAPSSFEITQVDTDDSTNPQPELLFESSDDMSGIDKYEMRIGEGDWFAIDKSLAGKLYQMPLQAPGDHTVTVKAFDNAGNFTTTTTTTTTIEPIKKLVIKEVTPLKTRVNGEPINVKGEALPGVTVELYARGSQKLAARVGWDQATKKIAEVLADQSGNWAAELRGDLLPAGKYVLYAYARDERGALSLASDEVAIEITGEQLYKRFIDLLMRGLDSLMNFLVNGWALIIAGVAVFAVVLIFIRKVIPFFATEISRFAHIAQEYNLSKDLRRRNKKLQFELRTLHADLEKELDLLRRIERHRGLSSSEKYFKAKVEKYLKLTKSLR